MSEPTLPAQRSVHAPPEGAGVAGGAWGEGGAWARRRGLVVFAIGVLLVGAACFAVVRDWATLQRAWSAARSAPAWMIVLVLVLPMANIGAVSMSFWVLTGRYGRVGRGEMVALITSAWLLNMLPLRPGFFGRVGYHKTVNGIAVRDSVKVLVQAIACNGAAMACALAMSVCAAGLGVRGPAMGAMLLAPALLMVIGAWAVRSAGIGAAWRGLASEMWRWPLAAAFRYLDILVWIVRYALMFAILGVPLSLVGATVTTLASEAAMLSPVQIGLREWVVGVTSAAFGAEAGRVNVADVTPGLTVDLVNRAIEIAVALPMGLAASAWLYRRVQRGERGIGGRRD